MPNQTLTLGDVLDITEAADQVFGFTSVRQQRGCLDNADGPNTVFINWLGETVVAAKTAGSNRGWIAKGESIRIPADCRSFSLACAASETAKLRYINDAR